MKDVTKQMFIKYYQYKLNIDLSFDQSLLESIGFRKCSGCAKLTYVKQNNNLDF